MSASTSRGEGVLPLDVLSDGLGDPSNVKTPRRRGGIRSRSVRRSIMVEREDGIVVRRVQIDVSIAADGRPPVQAAFDSVQCCRRVAPRRVGRHCVDPCTANPLFRRKEEGTGQTLAVRVASQGGDRWVQEESLWSGRQTGEAFRRAEVLSRSEQVWTEADADRRTSKRHRVLRSGQRRIRTVDPDRTTPWCI